MSPVRVLAIMEDEVSKQDAIQALEQHSMSGTVQLTVAEDMDHALKELVHNRCPFDLVISDLNFSDQCRQNTVLTLPETMQTGHFLALTALRANGAVRCILPINDERDISSAVGHYHNRALQQRVRFPGQNPEYDWMSGIRRLYPDVFGSAA